MLVAGSDTVSFICLLYTSVGGGIYTKGLVNKLDSLGMNGMEHATYCMINVKDHKDVYKRQASGHVGPKSFPGAAPRRLRFGHSSTNNRNGGQYMRLH